MKNCAAAMATCFRAPVCNAPVAHVSWWFGHTLLLSDCVGALGAIDCFVLCSFLSLYDLDFSGSHDIRCTKSSKSSTTSMGHRFVASRLRVGCVRDLPGAGDLSEWPRGGLPQQRCPMVCHHRNGQ